MLDLALYGSAREMRLVASLLRKAHYQDLAKDRQKGYRAAFRPLEREVKLEASATLPKAGGYAPLMARAVKVQIRIDTATKIVASARVFARGKKELRDVVAINNGRIRHPVYGNRARWSVTTVRPGFVTRPFDRTVKRAVDEADKAHQRWVERMARG